MSIQLHEASNTQSAQSVSTSVSISGLTKNELWVRVKNAGNPQGLAWIGSTKVELRTELERLAAALAPAPRLLGGGPGMASDIDRIRVDEDLRVGGPRDDSGNWLPLAEIEKSVRSAAKVASGQTGIPVEAGQTAEEVLFTAHRDGSEVAQQTLAWVDAFNEAELTVSFTARFQSGRTARLTRTVHRTGFGAKIQDDDVRQRLIQQMIQEESSEAYPDEELQDVENMQALIGRRIALEHILMRGVSMQSKLWANLRRHDLGVREGTCVLDYIAQEVVLYCQGRVTNPFKGGLDDASIRSQFSKICDPDLGVSVSHIEEWITSNGHPIDYFAIDPSTFEVFASRNDGTGRLNLVFVVAHNHLYPITIPALKRKITDGAQKVDPADFGLFIADTTNFGRCDDLDTLVEGKFDEDVVYTVQDLDELHQLIVERCNVVPDQLTVSRGRISGLVHPMTLTMIKRADDWALREGACKVLGGKYPCAEFEFRGQSVSKIARDLARVVVGTFPASSHSNTEFVDDYGAVPLVQRLEDIDWRQAQDPQFQAIDKKRAYTTAILQNSDPYPIFTAFDDFAAFDGTFQDGGEYVLHRITPLQGRLRGVTLPAQALCMPLARWLVQNQYLWKGAIRWQRVPKHVLPADTFRPLVEEAQKIEDVVGEKAAKLIVNRFVGCLAITHDSSDVAFVCSDFDEACSLILRNKAEGRKIDFVGGAERSEMCAIRVQTKKRRTEDHRPLWTHIIGVATLLVLQKAAGVLRSVPSAKLVGVKTDALLFRSKEKIPVDAAWKREDFQLPIASWIPKRKLFPTPSEVAWEEIGREQVSLDTSSFVTGPAGSGKTWLVMDLVKRTDKKVLCVAVTNAAVDNMRKRGGTENVQYSTICSALYRQQSGRFKMSEFDVLVIDEVSLVSTKQMTALIDGAPSVTCVLGDLNQLPPIQAGYVYDFTESGLYCDWLKRRCVLPYVPEFGRYDAQTKLVLDYLLEHKTLHPSLKGKDVDRSLNDNVTYTNRRREQVIKQRRGTGKLRVGERVIACYDSMNCTRGRAYKAAGFFHSAFHVIEAVSEAGFRVDGVPLCIHEKPPHTPVPFAPNLESIYLPSPDRIVSTVRSMLSE